MKITPIRGKVRVVEPFRYRDVVVPAGYVSNGATLSYLYYAVLVLAFFNVNFLWILALLLFVVRTPFYPSSLQASVVHDYLCEKRQYRKADAYFLEILLKKEDKIRAYSKWLGVRVYHIILRKTEDG